MESDDLGLAHIAAMLAGDVIEDILIGRYTVQFRFANGANLTVHTAVTVRNGSAMTAIYDVQEAVGSFDFGGIFGHTLTLVDISERSFLVGFASGFTVSVKRESGIGENGTLNINGNTLIF